MANCPNKNLKDWSDLVNKLGEDGAYYVYIKNGNQVPYLQDRGSNRLIWDVENALGLVSWKRDNGKNTKQYKGFSRDGAANLISKIRSQYVGDYTVARIAPNDRGEFGIKIEGYPLPKDEVEGYANDYNKKDMAEAIRDFQLYEEFKIREKEANEDILPLDTYDQRDGIYVEGTRKKTQEEKFNADQVASLTSILRNTMPQVSEVVEDYNLPENVIGRLEKGGIIRYNPEKLLKSTLGHEFGHLLIDLRGGMSDSFIREGIKQLKGSKLEQEIIAKYPDLAGTEQLQKEILAEAIGREVADIFESEEGKTSFERWLLRLFRWLSTRVGITKNNARQLASELLTGEPIDAKKYGGSQMTEVQEQREDQDVTDEEVEANREKIVNQGLVNKELNKYEKLRQRAEDIVSTRIRKAKNRGSLEDVSKLETLLKTLESGEIEDKRAIVQFVDNAIRQIGATFNLYEQKVRQEKAGNKEAFNIRTLTRWNDILSAYDILDDVSTVILEDGFRERSATFDKSTTAKFKRALDDAISKKNLLRDQFKSRGADMLTDALVPYTTRVIAETREDKKREWIKNNADTTLKGKERKEAMDKYAEDYIAANINDLMERTKLMFRAETEKASEDIGLLTRWLDTILDTNDMMMASMVKKFVVSNKRARNKSLELRNKMWPLVEQMYKNTGYTYLKTPPSKVYDFMLEKDNQGKRTGYIVSKFRSDLMEAYRKVLADTEMLPDKERIEKRKKWKEDNMPLDRKGLEEARAKYLTTLKNEGIITEEEITLFNDNLKRPFSRRFDLNTIINIEAADAIDKWHIENTFAFRNPTAKWKNPQWDALQKIIQDKNDPRTKFYTLIKEELKKVDRTLPFNKRKYDELPYKVKSNDERIANGQSIKSIGKEAWEELTTRRVDETERGQYTDENDKPIDYIPWFYQRPSEGFEHHFKYKQTLKNGKTRTKRLIVPAKTGEEARKKFDELVPGAADVEITKVSETSWTDDNQSYDLMGLYYNFFKMAYNYQETSDILPEMELTKRLSESRKYTVTDPKGNPIKKVLSNLRSKELTKEGAVSLLTQQFGDFMKAQAYGQGKAEEGSWDFMGWKFDKAKLVDNLGRYSSFNMLGLNLIQGISNVSVGELTQMTESIAGEFFTTKDLHKATVEYGRGLGAVLGDIGQEVPTSKLGLLNEKWDILNEYEGGAYKKNSRFARLMNTSAMYFTSHMGEHFLQTRIMLAMLSKIPAKNSQGEVIGNMLDMYKTSNGNLVLDERVDLEQSNWNEEQQILFGEKVKRLLSRLHGEYSDLGKSAAQRWAVGRMGLMFRKFIVPGFKRRWEKKKYNEFLGEYTEGSYSSTFKFLKQATMEMRALGLSAFSENWNTLLPREKQNIIRGVGEFLTATFIAVLAGAFLTLKGEADDDDERAAYATLAYLALRTKSELYFFINPMETFTILKSPAVATSMVENVIKLVGQMFHPWDVYERGSWKGYPKILKTIVNLTPGVKQYYKIRNIEDSLTFFIK